MKYIFTTWLAILLAGVAMSQDCSLRLSGHVEDADVHEKLSDAVVLIVETGAQLITDAKGDFTFSNLCAGNYTIHITHISCDTLIKKVTLTKDVHLDFYMPHARRVLGEVILQSQKIKLNTGFIKELSGDELRRTSGLSLADALSRLNGVNILQTGSTISKPVIHGLHGSRILTINNGVRQEGQQWGNEHAPEIDPFIADKLSVIKGVDELRYGSDAIGGVILVEPKALRHLPGVQTEWNAGFFTNNKQYVISGVAEFTPAQQTALAFRLQGTRKQGANINTPNYRLNNTAMNENSFSFTAGWKQKKFKSELFYSFFQTSLGIFEGAHIGNLTDLQNAINADKPDEVFTGENTYTIGRPRQQVEHHLVKWKGAYEKNGHILQATLAGQFNNRQEYDVVRSSSNKSPQIDLSINTFSQDFVWEQPMVNGFKGTAGLAFSQQKNSYSGRYFIPNYFAYTLGAFYLEKWKKHRWELQAGVRMDHKTIETSRLRFGGTTIDNDFRFNTLAGSINVLYQANKQWMMNVSVSASSRAPYVNELLSDGIHHGAATYEKGNLDLVPEQSVHLNIGTNYTSVDKKFEADLLLYAKRINDFIYRTPVPDSPVLTISGAFPLVEYNQTNAVLNGVDASFKWNFFSTIDWIGKFSLLYATNRSTDEWLIGMPANRFNSSLNYEFKDSKKWLNTSIMMEVEHVLEQTRIPGEEFEPVDYKLPPPAFTLWNMYFSTTRKIGTVPITIRFSVRNMFNISYRNYLNSMRYFTDDIGRNIGLNIHFPLNIFSNKN